MEKGTTDFSAVPFFLWGLLFCLRLLLRPGGVMPAGGGIGLPVLQTGMDTMALMHGHVPGFILADVVHTKMATGLAGLLLFFHGCHLLTLLYIILRKMQPLVLNGHHVYTI